MRKGFTLIEILVSVSIIGILTAVSFFAIQGSKVSARDTKRKADLEKIRSALEVYKADTGQYPLTVNEFLGWEVSYDGDWLENLPSAYLPVKSFDPLNTSFYTYRYSSCVAGTETATGMPNYKVEALLESGQTGKRCPQCTGHTGGVGSAPSETVGTNEWECVANP